MVESSINVYMVWFIWVLFLIILLIYISISLSIKEKKRVCGRSKFCNPLVSLQFFLPVFSCRRLNLLKILYFSHFAADLLKKGRLTHRINMFWGVNLPSLTSSKGL